MLCMIPLIVRRRLRNAPLTTAVLVGFLVLLTLLVAAPLHTSPLAHVGLRPPLADAPLDQRSVRMALPTSSLDQAEHARLRAAVEEAAQGAGWLKPELLAAIRTKRLALPRTDTTRWVTLVEADTTFANLRTVEGRLP